MLGGDGIEGERCAEPLRACPPGWYRRNAAERWRSGGMGLRSALDRLAYEARACSRLARTPLLGSGAEALRALAAGRYGRRAA